VPATALHPPVRRVRQFARAAYILLHTRRPLNELVQVVQQHASFGGFLDVSLHLVLGNAPRALARRALRGDLALDHVRTHCVHHAVDGVVLKILAGAVFLSW